MNITQRISKSPETYREVAENGINTLNFDCISHLSSGSEQKGRVVKNQKQTKQKG